MSPRVGVNSAVTTIQEILILGIFLLLANSVACLDLQAPQNAAQSIIGSVQDSIKNVIGGILSFPKSIWNWLFYLEPEVTMSTTELIQHNGYPVENYTIITRDGFRLTMYRIPGGPDKPVDPAKVPVLIVPGTEAEADCWVLNLANESLAFLAANAGYDVWLANIRCSKASCSHVSLKRNTAAFWDWSLDEMATHDMPDIIDLVLNVTGHRQLHYIGHSLAAQLIFSLLSSSTEYNAKVKTIFGLASQGNFADASFFLRLIANLEPIIRPLAKLVGLKEYTSAGFVPPTVLAYVAKFFPFIIELALSDSNLNTTRLPVYVAHAQGSTSFKVLIHDGQIINANRIQKYDYGTKGNMEKYGAPDPPVYDLKNVTSATYLYYGTKDTVVGGEKNAQFLKNNLGNVISVTEVGKDWTHNDMFLGVNASSLLYNGIIEIMDYYGS